MASSSDSGDTPPPSRTSATVEQVSPHGYNVGLHASTELGPVEVALTLEDQEPDSRSVGLFVDAPRMGRLGVGLTLDREGGVKVSSLQRQDGASPEMKVLPSRELELEVRVAELELQLAQEGGRSAAAQREVARLRERSLAEAVPELSERQEALDRAVAESEAERSKRLVLEAQREELTEALAEAQRALDEEKRNTAEVLAEAELSLKAEQARADEATAQVDEARDSIRTLEQALAAEKERSAQLSSLLASSSPPPPSAPKATPPVSRPAAPPAGAPRPAPSPAARPASQPAAPAGGKGAPPKPG